MMRCNLGNCPTGVTSQLEGCQRGLVPEVQVPRAARFHEKTLETPADIVEAVGSSIRANQQPHHIMHRTRPEGAAPADVIQRFLATGVLREASDETEYSDWWRAARADGFRPTIDLVDARSIKAVSASSEIMDTERR